MFPPPRARRLFHIQRNNRAAKAATGHAGRYFLSKAETSRFLQFKFQVKSSSWESSHANSRRVASRHSQPLSLVLGLGFCRRTTQYFTICPLPPQCYGSKQAVVSHRPGPEHLLAWPLANNPFSTFIITFTIQTVSYHLIDDGS